MAQERTQVRHIVRRFVKALSVDIPVEKVLLFGSYAQGAAKKESDIDIIVVSPSFNSGNSMEHMRYLFRKAARISSLLEPIPASPLELNSADPQSFLGQAIRSAKIMAF